MSLHIMSGTECIRVFKDHPRARPPFVGHKHMQFGSREYNSLVKRAQDTGAGIYFSVNKTDGHGARAENIVQVRTYYVDIDGLDDKTDAFERLITAKLKPSAIVETKNGVHAYWYAKNQVPVDYEEYQRVEVGLIRAFGGDPSVKDISRVLRVPGTYHMKDPEDPFEVRIVHQLPHAHTPYYTAEELLSEYPAPKPKPRKEVPVTDSPKRWQTFLEDLWAWEPMQGERNYVMLLSAGVAISFSVNQDTFVETMLPIVESWNTGRDERGELNRVARWAYSKGNPIPLKALEKVGVKITWTH